MYLALAKTQKALGGSHALDNRCNSTCSVAPRTPRRNRREPRSHSSCGVRDSPGFQSAKRSSRQHVRSGAQ